MQVSKFWNAVASERIVWHRQLEKIISYSSFQDFYPALDTMTTSHLTHEVLRHRRLDRRWKSSTPTPHSGRRFSFKGELLGAEISPGGRYFLAVFKDFSIQTWDLDDVSQSPRMLVPATRADHPIWLMSYFDVDSYSTPARLDLVTRTMVR